MFVQNFFQEMHINYTKSLNIFYKLNSTNKHGIYDDIILKKLNYLKHLTKQSLKNLVTKLINMNELTWN